VLDLVKEVRVAGESDALDVSSQPYEAEQTVEAFVLGCKIGVFDHLLNDWSIVVKWVLGIAVHFVFLLDLLGLVIG